MVLITIVNGVYKPTYNWGAPHCMYTWHTHDIGAFRSDRLLDHRGTRSANFATSSPHRTWGQLGSVISEVHKLGGAMGCPNMTIEICCMIWNMMKWYEMMKIHHKVFGVSYFQTSLHPSEKQTRKDLGDCRSIHGSPIAQLLWKARYMGCLWYPTCMTMLNLIMMERGALSAAVTEQGLWRTARYCVRTWLLYEETHWEISHWTTSNFHNRHVSSLHDIVWYYTGMILDVCMYIYIYHCILYICYIRRSTPPWIIPSNGCPPDCPSIPHPCSQGTGDSASFAPPKLLDRLVPCLEGNVAFEVHTIGTPPESRGDMARNQQNQKEKINLSTLHTGCILLYCRIFT